MGRALPRRPPYSEAAAPRQRDLAPLRRAGRDGGTVESTLGDVTNRNGRSALTTVGVIALILGAVWAGQGLNLIPGSFMTGSRTWLSIGIIVGIVGIVLIVLGLRRPRRSGRDR